MPRHQGLRLPLRQPPSEDAPTIGALELGGSHVSAGRVRVINGRPRVEAVSRLPLRADASRDELLDQIKRAAGSAVDASIAAWGVAVPGPFDYAGGISRILGVAKLEALYGADLRHELAQAVAAPASAIVFLNDADAFLLGEAWAGAARGCSRAVGITLGTGLGSAFLSAGRIVETGAGVPPEGRLDLLTLDGQPVEELVSSRGLLRTYRLLAGEDASLEGVAELAAMVSGGDRLARAAFTGFGENLGRFLGPCLEAFEPERLVIGGSIARAAKLFMPAFSRSCAPVGGRLRAEVARNLDSAALLGAAWHARHGAADSGAVTG